MISAAGTITALTANMLEDANASLVPGSLVGMSLYPKKSEASKFRVVSNTATQIYTDSADGDMTLVAAVGDQYEPRDETNINLVKAQMSLNGVVQYPGLILTNSTLSVDGTLQVPRLTMTGSTATVNGSLLVDTELMLQNASVLKHSVSTPSAEYRLYVKAGKVTVDATSQIDASGAGYRGGHNGVGESSGRTLGNALISGGAYRAGGS